MIFQLEQSVFRGTSHSKLDIMNWKMEFEMVNLNKCYFTNITNKFSLCHYLMKFLVVSFQDQWCGKWFITRVTFMVFATFMNASNMCIQIIYFRKWFATKVTFVVFRASMNYKKVFFQNSFLVECCVADVTFVCIVAFIMDSFNMG